MVWPNQNENVMRIEIKYYEIFQNDVFMEKKNYSWNITREWGLANPTKYNSKKWSRECEWNISGFACLEIVLEPYDKNALC